MNTKDSNPKDSIGIKKAPISTVPLPFIIGTGLAMLEGTLKYGRHNYRVVGVRLSVYVDAIFRHLAAMWEGQWIDPDSKLPHILKIGACAAIIFDAHIRGKLIDDRPPKTPEGWIDEANKQAADLILKYPNPVAPYLEKEITPSEQPNEGTGKPFVPPPSSQSQS